jgi:hypothetical protein
VSWCLVRRLRRTPLVANVRVLAAGGPLLLAAGRPAGAGARAAALAVLRLTGTQRALRRRVAAAARTGAYLGDIPAMLPRLQAETARIGTGLCHLGSSATPDSSDLLAAADRHVAVLTNLSDAVAATLALPPAGATLSQEAVDAALGLRLYAAAYAELTSDPTASTAPQRIAG